MTEYKLAFIGFGNVGKALAALLLRKQEELNELYDIQFKVVAIATGQHGKAISSGGLPLNNILQSLSAGESIKHFSTEDAPEDNLAFIRACPADVFFENTPVNYQTGQPALDHLRTALESGMHAFTANKGPVVHGYHQLKQLAQEKNKRFYFESTVMDGAPVFSIMRVLPAANVKRITGVLNSTTNLILSMMEEGRSFEEAVQHAQAIGVAETDPSGDIDGWDAAVKIAALITVYMDTPFTPNLVEREGIRGLTPEQIQAALQAGKRWKLLCSAEQKGGKIVARVFPQLIDAHSPLYSIDGTTSIVQIETDVLGKLSLIENDPGPDTTAYGLLADFINAVRQN